MPEIILNAAISGSAIFQSQTEIAHNADTVLAGEAILFFVEPLIDRGSTANLVGQSSFQVRGSVTSYASFSSDEDIFVMSAEEATTVNTSSLTATAQNAISGVANISGVTASVSNYSLDFLDSGTIVIESLETNNLYGEKHTVMFWMYKRSDAVAEWSTPFSFNLYGLSFDENGDYFGFNTGSDDIFGISSSGLFDAWVHVAAVFYNGTPSASNNKLYINGELQTISQQTGTSVLRTTTADARISGWPLDSNFTFTGYIDEVRIYSGELTAGVINRSLNCPTTSNLLHHWDLEEGTGTDASDSVGSSDGVISNALWSRNAPITLSPEIYAVANRLGNFQATLVASSSISAVGTVTDAIAILESESSVQASGEMIRHAGEVVLAGAPLISSDWSLYFNGGSDSVEVADLTVNTSISNKTTVSFWMYLEDSGSGIVMPFGFTDYDLAFDTDNDRFGFNTGGSDILGFSSSALIGNWTHIVAVFYNGTPSTSNNKIYVDGVEQTLTQTGTPLLRSVSSDARMSGWALDDNYKFFGFLNEVRIFDGEVSIQNIRDLARGADITSSLIHYWALEEGEGLTTADSVGSSNGALVPASPIWVNSSLSLAGGLLAVASLTYTSSATVSGSASLLATADPVDTRSITFSGVATIQADPFLNYNASGGLVLGGSADVNLVIRYVPTGLSNNAPNFGGITIGYTQVFNPTDVSVTYDVDLSIEWNVKKKIIIERDFNWSIGSLRLTWYRVQGTCEFTNSDTACDVLPFRNDDANCTGALGRNQYITNILASNLSDLCDRLIEMNWSWPIASIKSFSRPAENRFIEVGDTCNILQEEDFSEISECFAFALLDDPLVKMGVETFIVDTIFSPSTGGTILLSGSATAGVVPESHVATGGFTIGGAADCASSNWSYVSSGGLELGGVSDIVSSDWDYASTGGLVIAGESAIVSSYFTWVGTGGLTISGDAVEEISLSYISRGFGIVGPSFAGITLGGTLSLAVSYNLDTEGGLVIGGSSVQKSSNYAFEGSGSIAIAGEAEDVSSIWHYVSSSGFTIAGSHAFKFPLYSATGGLVIDGEGEYPRVWGSSGGFVIGGEAGVVAPNWNFTPTGGFVIGGESEADSGFLGELLAEMGSEQEIIGLEPVFGDIAGNPLVEPSVEIRTSCGCLRVPLVLEMTHNLQNASIFDNFLLRNGFSIPSIVNLVYNKTNAAWQANLHFLGTSGTDGQNERWNIAIEWKCTGTIGSVDLGGKFWQYSILFNRRNVVTGLDSDTRLVVGFPGNDICQKAQLSGLDFNFLFDTQTTFVETDFDIFVDISLLSDNIGIFKSRFWSDNPNLRINVSETVDPIEVERQDISEVLPEEEPFLVT